MIDKEVHDFTLSFCIDCDKEVLKALDSPFKVVYTKPAEENIDG